ncbi:hypothetical protein SEUCBS140593_006844, partial [Sporothrix eucalyptigena]
MPSDPSHNGQDSVPWITVSTKNSRRRGRHPVDVAVSFHSRPPPTSAAHPGALPGAGAESAATLSATATGTCAHIEAEHARVVARWRDQPSFSRLVDLIQAQASSHAPVTQA